MKIDKYRGKLDILREALNMMANVESNNLEPAEGIVIQSMAQLMIDLRVFLNKISDPIERIKKLHTFEIIQDIYYDKLEKEVNTTH